MVIRRRRLHVSHPAVTVAVEFGDRPFDIHGAAGRMRSESLAAGLAFGAFQVRAAGVERVQIRLSPLVAYPVLGLPLAELRGSVIALDDLWGRDTWRLRERLHHAGSWRERFALIDAELSTRLHAGSSADPEVAWAWQQIVAGHGRVRVSDLAARTGWSRHRTWSRFGSQISLTPKRAAMLVRFDQAVHRLAHGHTPARVAADCGYADQSHPHHDVRAFTGTPPPPPRTSHGWLPTTRPGRHTAARPEALGQREHVPATQPSATSVRGFSCRVGPGSRRPACPGTAPPLRILFVDVRRRTGGVRRGLHREPVPPLREAPQTFGA
ncbi:AraC family transcriptional regulator [Streptomyces sp. NBC_00572]|uniref:helix-turn-helix domain-containing protein n=1 Tax=Streptomyces sp. NBC_00572 TaxID=2903664 RepID=UPI002251AD38|nr:helix-turn-helix domain-containing protein [Streptomyces sp. NBC_00572]MCX4985958.1 helix-turn-helix domain-containing protein [Streptomyces sp. NBC_00572]